MIGIGIVVLLAILPTIVLVQYITASTPDKTLDAFCNAVLQGNYQDAYAQFSPKLQQAISEASLASVFSQDKVTACTHGTTDAHGTSVTDTLKLVHASQGVNKDIVTLVKGSNNIWQIDDIYQQT
jgi:hypothetical protein